MIFVTVGSQIPFDRLIRGVDDWAGSRGYTDVYAQIGPSDLKPKHIQWSQFIEPDEFQRRVAEAKAVVAHVGMGTIITALELGTPILVMPRKATLGEATSEHQLATAKHLIEHSRVTLAVDEHDLVEKLDHIDSLAAGGTLGSQASPTLVDAIRGFIDEVPNGY